jgi:hypothetical protein
MSFSLETGYSEQQNKKRRWVHANPLFGTRGHIDRFLQVLGLSNVKPPEYLAALDQIRPQIEQNLIQLGTNELPDGAAFRIPEPFYLGIFMGKDDLKGKSQTIDYIRSVLQMEECQYSQEQSSLSCYLPYLYPYWYASSKDASFIYAEGKNTHYKRLSIDDMARFRFLKLTTSMNELKQKMRWNEFMITPQEVIAELRAISDYDSLHRFMMDVTNSESDRRPIPIDSIFVNAFIEKCKELELVMTFDQFNATRKLIIEGTGILTDQMLESSNWYKNVFKILKLNGMVELTKDMRGLIVCVACFEILTPLGMRFRLLNYITFVMEGIDFPKLLRDNPQYGDGKPLLNTLEGYCMNNKYTETERAEIGRINPNVNWQRIYECKISYDTLLEHSVNISNCGIMNYNLTSNILDFIQRWFLNGTINTLFGISESRPYTVRNDDYQNMMQNYGQMYRNSTPTTDFIFAVCLNILLFHLYPQHTPVGYYLGQCIVASRYGRGFKYNSMNAELTIMRSANIRNVGLVRKLTFTESGHETGPETDDDADDYDDRPDDYLGGKRKGKNHRQTTRKSKRNARRRKSTVRKLSKRKHMKK